MADYWKSQPRHFCEFCKCWTADNKPSRDFHEKGKRHQENVKKKLDDLRKKGLADAKLEKETSSYLQQMEKGALRKLKEDLAENPALAAQYGVKLKQKEAEKEATKTEEKPDVGEWCEATTPEGYTYYWNTVTMESRWELPVTSDQPEKEPKDDEPEQPVAKKIKTEDTDEQEIKQEAPSEVDNTSNSDEPTGDVVHDVVDTSFVAHDVPDTSESAVESIPLPSEMPSSSEKPPPIEKVAANRPARQPQHSAYGKWETVLPDDEQQQVDLQLPVDAAKSAEKTVVIVNEPKIKFREKKVTNFSGPAAGGTSINFRKPKVGIQRSIRTTDYSEEN